MNRKAHPPAHKLPVLAIGDSHLVALNRAYTALAPRLPIKIAFIRLDLPEYQPALGKKGELNPTIRQTIIENGTEIVLSSIGGNTHNVLGLLNHAKPFDFVLPEQPDLPLDENAEVLPSGLLQEVFRERLAKGPFLLMRAVAEATAAEMLHLEPPPPIPGKHILHCPGVFGPHMKEFGVAPALLRYKLWRLHSAMLKSFCAGLGIEFVPVPEHTQDTHGMLVENAWGQDPTHGNEWFGAQMIDQALRVMGSRAFSPVLE